ncbi:hypothetical protein [Pedobacter sp.]|uniref:hypothetical protein n=1 Tax=Pedobacter sp. TaxID=1411316 RepID=UPI003BAAAC77
MKTSIIFTLLTLICFISFAQSETYDIVYYQPPKNWKKENTTAPISYSKIDGNNWGQIAIYNSTTSKGDIDSDSNAEWEALVLALRIVEDDETSSQDSINGWAIKNRSGNWMFNGNKVLTVLTTFSNGKTCLSIMCNMSAKDYLEDFKNLIASIKLNSEIMLSSQTASESKSSSQIIGVWSIYINETSGFINGMPQTTGGYFRKEYKFNNDGTYTFYEKNFPAYHKNIGFKRENGTWLVKNNTLTITPAEGKTETWTKSATGRNDEWGKLISTSNSILEKTAYTFDFKYLSGMEKTYLILNYNKATERDGKQNNNANQQHSWQYPLIKPAEALINFPPK